MVWIALEERQETGHPMIDSDHAGIVEIINQLASAITQHKSKDVCGKLLDQIIHDTKAHFARENRLMAEHHYPKADQHQAEHARLIGQSLDLKIWFDAAPAESVMSVSLLHFLEDWWTRHIPSFDKELADFIAAQKP